MAGPQLLGAAPARATDPAPRGYVDGGFVATSKVGLDAARAGRDRAARGWSAALGSKTVATPALLLFGHSVVAGYGATGSAGFAQRLQQRLPAYRPGLNVVVDGQSGYTSTQLAARAPSNVSTIPDGTLAGVAFMGMLNDYYNGVASATTKANLLSMIAAYKASTKSRSDLSFVLLIEWLRNDLPGSPAEPWSNYVNVAQQVAAADPQVTVLDLAARLGNPGDSAAYFADGAHPNDVGYGVLTGVLWEQLTRGQAATPPAVAPSQTAIPVSVLPPVQSANFNAYPISVMTAWGGFVRESDGTQNGYLEYEFTGDAGTYTIALAHRAGSNRGRYSTLIDGIAFGTENNWDGYQTVAGDRIDPTAGFTIPTSGRHRIRLTMSSKNSSSTSYVGSVAGLLITRTGD